jgi:diguanylate cyclase (GGDEF)-like protein/PAS domain S-box-containing protein
MGQNFTRLMVEHDWRLVVLASVVCFLASAVAISLFHRAEASTGRGRWVWLSLDAAATGYGIWATHYIALLAYQHSLGAGYSLALTITSLLLAILTTAAGLIIALGSFGRWHGVIGGAVVGFGIAVMHFTGLAALDLPGSVTWSLDLVAAAVVSGAVISALAFFVAARRNDWPNTVAAVSLLTLAVISTHFIAMAAMLFVPDQTPISGEEPFSPEAISALLAGMAALILGMCLVAALSDRQSKEKLQQQKVLLDATLANLSQGVCMYDADGRVVLFNERYAAMTKFSSSSLNGRHLIDLLKQRGESGDFEEDPEIYYTQLVAKLKEGKSISRIIEAAGEHTLRLVDHPMQGGGWVTTIEDITDWEEAQAQIAHMARHDALTNLPNRTLFREELEQALVRTARNEQVAVLCIDLDHFKDVNDSLGHPVGDDLLKEVAVRLSDCVRKSDTVARLGGDEFAIVQTGSELQVSHAAALASRLVEVMAAPYDIQGQQIVIGASVGVSVAPNDGTDPDQLLRNADMALYLAKADGRGAYRFFEPGMDARAQARRIMMIDLRAALVRDEFEVYYQSIYDLETDRIICFEALVRWNHPLRGMVMPQSFIALAEESGLIIPIGGWVLQKACQDAAGWPKHVSVAVNLSPAQFKSPNLVSSIIASVTAAGLEPRRLEIEITESVLLQDSEATLVALHQLREFGVHISMDDFGTGYSSLSYLRSFPFDKIKIDQSFVHELAARGDSLAIVRAVTGLGKSLGIATTAEGVETKEQLALLRTEGCTQVQGFLLSQPQPASEVDKMLSNGKLRDVA